MRERIELPSSTFSGRSAPARVITRISRCSSARVMHGVSFHKCISSGVHASAARRQCEIVISGLDVPDVCHKHVRAISEQNLFVDGWVRTAAGCLHALCLVIARSEKETHLRTKSCAAELRPGQHCMRELEHRAVPPAGYMDMWLGHS